MFAVGVAALGLLSILNLISFIHETVYSNWTLQSGTKMVTVTTTHFSSKVGGRWLISLSWAASDCIAAFSLCFLEVRRSSVRVTEIHSEESDFTVRLSLSLTEMFKCKLNSEKWRQERADDRLDWLIEQENIGEYCNQVIRSFINCKPGGRTCWLVSNKQPTTKPACLL